MAAPNLISLTTVNIKTAILAGPTSVTDLIAAVASGKAVNIEAVYCSNIHASLAAYATVIHKQGGTEYKIANRQRVSTNQTINVLLGKPLYLEEGDSLLVQADAVSTLIFFAPYSIVT